MADNILTIQGKIARLAELRQKYAEALREVEEAEKDVKTAVLETGIGVNLKAKHGINASLVAGGISRKTKWEDLFAEFPEAEKYVKVSNTSPYVRLYYSDLK